MHLALSLRSAMTVFFKHGNKATCATFCRRCVWGGGQSGNRGDADGIGMGRGMDGVLRITSTIKFLGGG